MATDVGFIEYVAEQLYGTGFVRYRKMFGEYMVYVNDKPVLLVCDSTCYIKMKPEVEDLLKEADTGVPYKGTKEHYILDIDNRDLVSAVIAIMEEITPVPKKRAKK